MEGRRVLVTGAGTGIGRGIGAEFAREGAKVIFHYSRSRDGAEAAAAEVRAAGGWAQALHADFRDAAQARDLPARAAAAMGGLDVLVNNAGITMNEPLLTTTVEQFDTVFAVNIRALFFCTQGAAAIMVPAGRGVVVNISSVHAYGGLVEHAVYAATKSAIVGFTRTVSIELIQKNVRVNCIASGWVMVENQLAEMGPGFDPVTAGRVLPRGYAAQAADIGKAAIFLASEDSRFIVGQTILCDGGQTTLLPCSGDFHEPTTIKWGKGYVPGR